MLCRVVLLVSKYEVVLCLYSLCCFTNCTLACPSHIFVYAEPQAQSFAMLMLRVYSYMLLFEIDPLEWRLCIWGILRNIVSTQDVVQKFQMLMINPGVRTKHYAIAVCIATSQLKEIRHMDTCILLIPYLVRYMCNTVT